MPQKVVIIGHSYSSRLALIHSLGQAGYDVDVIVTMYGQLSVKKPLDCYSKYVNNVYYCKAKDESGLIDLLLNQCIKQSSKVVIIPDSDYSAAFVDKNRELLSRYFLFPHVDNKGFVANLMDKERQKKLAQEVGLNVPGTTTAHVCNGVIPELENVYYPCFTKALTTMGGGKQWFKKCDNEEELRHALTVFAKGGEVEILVEDFIDIEKEYAVVGLTDGINVIIPGVIEFVENCQCHLGIARKGRIIPPAGFEELLEQFKAYVKKTHFIGLFDIDFLYSKGRYYFCEMNFRYGGSGYAYTKSGINLPAMFVEMITGNKQWNIGVRNVTAPQNYVNERMMLDDLNVGNVTIRNFDRAINSADIRFMHDESDPKPERLFRKMVLKTKVKHILRKILHKK